MDSHHSKWSERLNDFVFCSSCNRKIRLIEVHYTYAIAFLWSHVDSPVKCNLGANPKPGFIDSYLCITMGWEHAKLGISKYQNPFESPNPLSHQLTGARLWLKGWEEVQNK